MEEQAILKELREAAQAAADQTHSPAQQRVFSAIAAFAEAIERNVERDVGRDPAPDEETTQPA